MQFYPRLADILETIGDAAIAVSGGVDSLTLATAACRLSLEPLIVHGVSPAVPAAATERVREFAAGQGWRLQVVDAGEFGDSRYRANPVNRCYFCKANLYTMIASLSDGTVLSGANLDDLGDYRPGLRAASEQHVRHPFIEAQMTKADVRALARELGLPEVAALPASPCLASRIETGIAIEPADLLLIDRVEGWLRQKIDAKALRLRRRKSGWVVEMDGTALSRIDPSALRQELGEIAPEINVSGIAFAAYRRGSAFIGAGQ